MAATSFSYVLGLIFIIGLTAADTCYNRAKASSSRTTTGRRRLLGGFREISNPSSSDDVQKILDLALSQLNTLSNGDTQGVTYELDRGDDGNLLQLEAFKQLVNGINFCVKFQVRKTCSNCADNNLQTMTCDVQAYQHFRDPVPSLRASNGDMCY